MSKAKSHEKNGTAGIKQTESAWVRAFTSNSEWPDKEEFLDVIYWGRQALGIVIGLLWGLIPLRGFIGLFLPPSKAVQELEPPDFQPRIQKSFIHGCREFIRVLVDKGINWWKLLVRATVFDFVNRCCRFVVINAGLIYIYFTNFQNIDEEEYGGAWEITKEGFMTSFAGFLVTWIIIYSGLNFD